MARSSLKNIMRMIDDAKQTLPPEKDFLNDLKTSIELTNSKSKVKGSQSYKPSSMNCIRQMYYIVIGADADAEIESYSGVGICNSGTDIHQRLQQAVLDMKKNGIDCEYVNVADYVESRGLDYLEIVKRPNFKKKDYETKLYHKTLNMSFLCDGIIRYKGKYYILEFKSEKSAKFWNREDVDPYHYNQGTAYSSVLQIDDVLFVYVNRDTLEMKSFMFTPTDDMKQSLIGKIETCDSYVAKLTPPPKPSDVERKTCSYCKYASQCKKDGG